MSESSSVPSDLVSLVTAIEKATGVRPRSGNAIRWVKYGVSGVRLKAWRLGGRYVSNTDSVNEFVSRVTAMRNSAEVSK